MEHFDITDWADYVRAVADSADRAAMKRHFDAGCESCAAMVTALERLATTATGATPPPGVLRSVKEVFAVQPDGPQLLSDDRNRMPSTLEADS
jgi:hypothetical protein